MNLLSKFFSFFKKENKKFYSIIEIVKTLTEDNQDKLLPDDVIFKSNDSSDVLIKERKEITIIRGETLIHYIDDFNKREESVSIHYFKNNKVYNPFYEGLIRNGKLEEYIQEGVEVESMVDKIAEVFLSRSV